MKRTYLQPLMNVLAIRTSTIIAVSGNFTEGDTTEEPIHDETIDGGDAWSRYKNYNIWDNDEE